MTPIKPSSPSPDFPTLPTPDHHTGAGPFAAPRATQPVSPVLGTVRVRGLAQEAEFFGLNP
jgi:hypothetical protein